MGSTKNYCSIRRIGKAIELAIIEYVNGIEAIKKFNQDKRSYAVQR